jgi:hypothetical protein
MHTLLEHRGRKIAVTNDALGWHVQAFGKVVSRRLLVDALEVALPSLSQPERDRLTVALLERAIKAAERMKSLAG